MILGGAGSAKSGAWEVSDRPSNQKTSNRKKPINPVEWLLWKYFINSPPRHQ